MPQCTMCSWPVQWIFMYEPIAVRLLAHAESIGEPEALVARARKAVRQPGDSARHDDHMHVRVYCARADRAYGCVDLGSMELLAEREAEELGASPIAAQWNVAGAGAGGAPPASGAAPKPAPSLEALGRVLRAGSHRIDLRRWR